MACPECGSGRLELLRSDNDGVVSHEEYTCLDCCCEWSWDMELTIIEHGRKVT